MSAVENKNEREDDKKEKKETPLQTNLKTTTETSQPMLYVVGYSKILRIGKIFGGKTTELVKRPYFTLLEVLTAAIRLGTYFFLSKFDSKDVSCEEKLPKDFKHFDHLLPKILLNLEETENVFMNQAKAVMDRDLILINWRFRLSSLQKSLREKKRDFERIDQTVQCILRLSSHIDSILSKLEKELPQPSLIENAFKYSPTRMALYDTMMKISISQRDMMQQLSSAVLSINETIECNPSDPVEQFIRILSLHTEVLRTIEFRTGLVEEQIKVLSTLHKYYTSTKKPVLCHCYY